MRAVDGVTNSVKLVANDEYHNIGVSNFVGLIIYIRVGSSLILFLLLLKPWVKQKTYSYIE